MCFTATRNGYRSFGVDRKCGRSADFEFPFETTIDEFSFDHCFRGFHVKFTVSVRLKRETKFRAKREKKELTPKIFEFSTKSFFLFTTCPTGGFLKKLRIFFGNFYLRFRLLLVRRSGRHFDKLILRFLVLLHSRILRCKR